MNFKVSRKEEYLEKIKTVLKDEYDFIAFDIIEANRGVDGETWIAQNDKQKVFIKIAYYKNHQNRFIKSLESLEYIGQNIKYVNHIIKSKNNSNFINFNKGILAVFEFIDGQIDYKYPYDKIMNLLLPIYKSCTNNKVIPQEDYQIDELIHELKTSYHKVIELNKDVMKYNIDDYINKLQKYDKLINKDTPKYLTHGDACVNVMVGDRITLIDWDDALMSPIERDCWFFLDDDKKIININKLLKDELTYELNKDMLAYYAYKSVVIYTKDILNKYLEQNNPEILTELEDIFNGWVYQKISTIKKGVKDKEK